MSCNCTNGCHVCAPESVIRQVFNCPGSQRVIKHQHIVKHQHDVIHEYDVVHEHEYNTHDVVREREVVRNNDCRTHEPNYCGPPCETPCDNECGVPVMPVMPHMNMRGFVGRNHNFFGRR